MMNLSLILSILSTLIVLKMKKKLLTLSQQSPCQIMVIIWSVNSHAFELYCKSRNRIIEVFCREYCTTVLIYQAQRKQLESGAAKTEEILKTTQQKGFNFFISKFLVLTGKKHWGESRRCRNASAGPVY